MPLETRVPAKSTPSIGVVCGPCASTMETLNVPTVLGPRLRTVMFRPLVPWPTCPTLGIHPRSLTFPTTGQGNRGDYCSFLFCSTREGAQGLEHARYVPYC